MAITYPVAIPTSKTPMACEISLVRDQNTHKAYSNKQVVQKIPADRWQGKISLPLLSPAEASDWLGWLDGLDGMVGSFTMAHPDFDSVLGTADAQGAVMGGGQTGTTITMDGFGTSATLKRGDMLQIGADGASPTLHRVTQDATAVAGVINVDIAPPRYIAPADNTAVYTTNQKGTFRLQDGSYNVSSDSNKFHTISFAIESAAQE